MDVWNMPAAVSSLFAKGIVVFLPQYFIFITFNASSDMYFHPLRAIAWPWL
jgi:hypothetical protein